MEEVKENIILALKDKSPMTTTAISNEIKQPFWKTYAMLLELSYAKMVERDYIGEKLIWRLVEKKEKQDGKIIHIN
jgi:hypothetical protein